MVPRGVTMEGCNPRMNNFVKVVAFNSQIPRYSSVTPVLARLVRKS